MMWLYRIYLILVAIPILGVWTIVTATVTFLTCIVGLGRWGGYYPQVLWARLFCWLTFVRVRVRGRENVSRGTSYLFLANHQGAYDIFSIYGWLGHDFRWMMKEPLRKIPFVGFACAASGQIFVDNRSVAAVKRTMAEAQKRLAGGMSLVVFPEGSRTRDGRLRPFKKGAFRLAMEFGRPVVPVTIDGSYGILVKGHFLPRPGRITLTIHKPIAVEQSEDAEAMERLMAETRRQIESAL